MAETIHFEQRDVALTCGVTLPRLVTSGLAVGHMAPNRDNVILVGHGYTGGPAMIEPNSDDLDSWSELIGPGKALDTDRYFIICPNAIGSCHGSTGADSLDPLTGRRYGSRFPQIGMADIVASQRALVAHLGVERLIAVVGPSFGGAQALQWGADFPDMMKGLVVAVAAPTFPKLDVPAMRREFEAVPEFHHGDYCGCDDLKTFMAEKRVAGLKQFGVDAVLRARFPDADAREQEIQRIAKSWAENFDANALINVAQTMNSFDLRQRLKEIRAPLLYVLSSNYRFFPASQAPSTLAAMSSAGLDVRYFEIETDHGHFAAGTEAAKWAGALRAFLNQIDV